VACPVSKDAFQLGTSTDDLESPSVICVSLLWNGAFGVGVRSSAGVTPQRHSPPDIEQYSSMSSTGAGSSQQLEGTITVCWHTISVQSCSDDEPIILIPTRGSPANKRIKMVSIRIIRLSLTPCGQYVKRQQRHHVREKDSYLSIYSTIPYILNIIYSPPTNQPSASIQTTRK